MAYYHTYRPKQFAELIGQDHIRTTLQNALGTGRVAHAYLFAGPKGSGKTTTARLLARAVNCLKVHRPPPAYRSGRSTVRRQKPSSARLPASPDQLRSEASRGETARQVDSRQSTKIEPCNICDSCNDILTGKSLDIIEIDAASNRGIDEIRTLKERLLYPPTSSKKKIYIIDEIHMLTREAFNALLKTLEEPPSHIMFIFATTEPYRLPETILSRVQRFDFHRATRQDMAAWLTMIAIREKVEINQAALSIIAGRAGGAFRDAAVLLEQVVGYTQQPITEEIVAHVVGLAPEAAIQQLIDDVLAGNGQRAITGLDALFDQGADCSELARQLIAELRLKLRQTWSYPIITSLNALLKAQANTRYSPIPQLPLELAIFELAKMFDPTSGQDIRASSNPVPDSRKAKEGQVIKDSQVVEQSAWLKVIDGLKPHNHSLAGMLRLAQPRLVASQAIINLVVPFKFHKDRIMDAKNRKNIEAIIEQIFGQSLGIECIIDPSVQVSSNTSDDHELAKAAEVMFE